MRIFKEHKKGKFYLWTSRERERSCKGKCQSARCNVQKLNKPLKSQLHHYELIWCRANFIHYLWFSMNVCEVCGRETVSRAPWSSQMVFVCDGEQQRYSSGSFHRSALISLFHLQALCSYKHPQSTGLWSFCLCVYSEKSGKYVNFRTKRTRMNNRRRG